MTGDLPQGGILYDVLGDELVVRLFDESGIAMTFRMSEKDALKAIRRIAECLMTIGHAKALGEVDP